MSATDMSPLQNPPACNAYPRNIPGKTFGPNRCSGDKSSAEIRFFAVGPIGCGRPNPLIGRRIECSFLRFFELIDILGKFPRVSACTSLLSCSLFWRSVLKFHSVKTSLMRIFDLYFPERRTFFFSDVCLTQRSPSESYSSNCFQHSFALPRDRYRFWRLSVL